MGIVRPYEINCEDHIGNLSQMIPLATAIFCLLEMSFNFTLSKVHLTVWKDSKNCKGIHDYQLNFRHRLEVW